MKNIIKKYIYSMFVFVIVVFLYRGLTGETKAFTPTTCESILHKGAPSMLPYFLSDYKQTYCTDKTPINGGNGKCYTKTLACSINALNNPYWCVSTECYDCYNEEVAMASCQITPTLPPSLCMKKNAEWNATSFKCSDTVEYGHCTADGYKCKCDDTGVFNNYPVLRKDASCQGVAKVTCEKKPLLLPLITAYNSNDYKTAYTEMKKNFNLSNTQVSAGSTGCIMPGALFIDNTSTGYCANLKLDANLSLGCSCWSMIDLQMKNSSSPYDYSRMKDIQYCTDVIFQIITITQ